MWGVENEQAGGIPTQIYHKSTCRLHMHDQKQWTKNKALTNVRMIILMLKIQRSKSILCAGNEIQCNSELQRYQLLSNLFFINGLPLSYQQIVSDFTMANWYALPYPDPPYKLYYLTRAAPSPMSDPLKEVLSIVWLNCPGLLRESSGPIFSLPQVLFTTMVQLHMPNFVKNQWPPLWFLWGGGTPNYQ